MGASGLRRGSSKEAREEHALRVINLEQLIMKMEDAV
jgi:hypothetical protein